MTCVLCGKHATWKGRHPIVSRGRRTISAMKFWCETCKDAMKASTPGTIAVEIEDDSQD